jgi:hypothetical protein
MAGRMSLRSEFAAKSSPAPEGTFPFPAGPGVRCHQLHSHGSLSLLKSYYSCGPGPDGGIALVGGNRRSTRWPKAGHPSPAYFVQLKPFAVVKAGSDLNCFAPVRSALIAQICGPYA